MGARTGCEFAEKRLTGHEINEICENSTKNALFRVFRVFRGPKENLSLHGTDRQHSFAEDFVEHLGEAGVDRGEGAKDAFVSSEMLEAGTRIRVVADSE